MIFTELAVRGAWLMSVEPIEDERGFFARTWDVAEMNARGLDGCIVQCSVSYNAKRGTLRGMHYQAAPHEETKVVRCVRGSAYDVVLDVRNGSPTYGKWAAVELSASNRLAVYIPKGVAHGFQTLEDHCELVYSMSEAYHLESARGVLWNDPAFAIRWPLGSPILSDGDRNRPLTVVQR